MLKYYGFISFLNWLSFHVLDKKTVLSDFIKNFKTLLNHLNLGRVGG